MSSAGPAKILISACLLGRPVRYDGAARTLDHVLITAWRDTGRLVPICPELAAGLPVPRPPAEIADGASGPAVIAGVARVITDDGGDVTGLYRAGAETALALALSHDCRFALLVDGSPSCGSRAIYDGSFSGRRHAGLGVTAALLRANGVAVFAETEIDALATALDGGR